jgi:hypothetical protein
MIGPIAEPTIIMAGVAATARRSREPERHQAPDLCTREQWRRYRARYNNPRQEQRDDPAGLLRIEAVLGDQHADPERQCHEIYHARAVGDQQCSNAASCEPDAFSVWLLSSSSPYRF